MKKTNQKFKEELYNLWSNEIKPLEDYKGCFTKIKFLHTICNKIYETTPNTLLQKHGCPYCYGKNIQKTTGQFKKEIFNLVNNEYILLSEYKNTKTKVELLHELCKNIFQMRPSDFLNGRRCPICFGTKKKNSIQINQEIESLTNKEYSLYSRYINRRNKILIKHNVCNNIFKKYLYHFKNNIACPYCNNTKSLPETILENYFINNRIKYEYNKTFSDCKHIQKLRFDFYLSEYNMCIEYNGKQHYDPIDIFGGEKELLKIQHRDKIKIDYCCYNNIQLLIIPYTEFKNIEKILLHYIKGD